MIGPAVDHLTDLVSAGKVTQLVGACDVEYGNAVVLTHHRAAN